MSRSSFPCVAAPLREDKRAFRYFGLALLVLACLGAFVDASNPPVVRTNFGQIRGKWSRSTRNVPVANFLGIPYAQPPLGDLRFRSPRPWNRTWFGIRDGTKDGPQCVQQDRRKKVYGSEDCLYLNIFVPLISGSNGKETKLPVMVFVHGGAFRTGSSDSRKFAPDYLLNQQIILVTLNYRLNVLGFFSTATKAVPGNFGIKDIFMALKWINKNIQSFGGDPDSVTVFGQSAGAASVHFLALSNKTEGLFSKYILHSGSAVNPWAIHSPKILRKVSIEMARMVGCLPTQNDIPQNLSAGKNGTVDAREVINETIYNSTDIEDQAPATSAEELYRGDFEDYSEEMMKCMRSVSTKKMMRASTYYHVWRENPWVTFGPTIEPESADALITMHPMKVIKEHLFRDMPCVIGVVEDEGLVKTLDAYGTLDAQDELINDFEKYLPYVVEFHEIIANTSVFAEAVRSFYFNDNLTNSLMHNLTEMVGDALITWPLYEAMKYQAQATSNASIYFFQFAYEGTFTVTFASGIPVHYGIAHSDELNYLFPILNNMFPDLSLHNTGDDWTMINIMTEMWTNFARSGVPSAWLTPQWPDYRDHRAFMKLGTGRSPDVTIEKDFLTDRMEFWEMLMPNITVDIVDLSIIGDKPTLLDDDENHGSISLWNPLLICLLIPIIIGLS